MSGYKICIYAISKNEEQFVDRWMDSVNEADMVVVLDTGSTDKTVEKLRRRGATVYEEKIDPWRFDVARNRAMDYIPVDVDICVSNDIDEVFKKGWRKELEVSWTPHCTRARYWFIWNQGAEGEPEKRFIMEKIHLRHGFKWVHPVHEVLEYSGDIPDNTVFVGKIELYHFPDPLKPRSQYLPLLEMSIKENPNDDRTMFWLGREYIFNGRNDEGISTLMRHLEMPGATWDEERSASMRFISRAYRAKGNAEQARIWLYKSIAECSRIREPWLDLAQLGYGIEDWPLVFYAVEKGLLIRNNSNSYLVEPEAWGHSLYDLGAIACYQLGLIEKAEIYADAASAISPNNERLKRNHELILMMQGGRMEYE